jgi:CRP-like cAMP-binding protein
MGDPGEELYIVEQGRLAIFAPSDSSPGEEQPIRIFRPGGVVGEMAVIDRQPRSLSARALEPTFVLGLRGETFRRLLRQNPDMALAVMVGLNDRIRYTTEFLNEVRGWVGRLSQDDYERESVADEMQGWMKQLSAGRYDETIQATANVADPTIANLAAEFATMAAQVQKREQQLRREIAQLRIEIDEVKRKREVEDITGTDYFQSLRAKVKTMREEQGEQPE